MKLPFVVATLFLAVLATPASAASLLGSDVSVQGFYPNLSTPFSALIGPVVVTDPGVEFPADSINPGRGFGFDIKGNQIDYLANENIQYGNGGPGAFNGFVLTFAGAPTIASVTLDSATNFAPVDFSFTGNTVTLNYNGLAPNLDSVTILDVTFAGVPEPAAWAMTLLGLAACGAALRMRRRVVEPTSLEFTEA